MILGLAGVLIWTSPQRFSTMRLFYVDMLGLEPRTDRIHFVNFQLGAERLTIGVHPSVSGISQDPLRIMINLAVEDIDRVHERLVSEGVPCMRPPSVEPWGGRVASYSDPDGNTIQLLAGTSG